MVATKTAFWLAFLAAVAYSPVSMAMPRSENLSPSLQRRDIGCDAYGPLEESIWGTWEIRCKPGDKLLCRATDETGCAPADPSGVFSLTIEDSITRQHLGGSSSVNSASGTCTDSKMVKCVLRLTDRSLGKNYGLIFGIDN